MATAAHSDHFGDDDVLFAIEKRQTVAVVKSQKGRGQHFLAVALECIGQNLIDDGSDAPLVYEFSYNGQNYAIERSPVRKDEPEFDPYGDTPMVD
jgi:hypothetical protein